MNRSMIPLLALLAAVACENMGLDYAGPAEDARHRPPPELVAAVIAPATTAEERELIMDGRMWMPARAPLALEEEDVRPIGSANGRTVYTRSWDQPPYDRLFIRAVDAASIPGGTEASAPRGALHTGEDPQWVSYLPVIGGGGGPRASAAPGRAPTGDAGGH